MKTINYHWQTGSDAHDFTMVYVEGTKGHPYAFGEADQLREIDVPSFYIAVVPVTQALWTHVMGSENRPFIRRGDNLPVENVSWDELTQPAGFLDRINRGQIPTRLSEQQSGREVAVRLPSETEWEYAARGGPHWHDGYRFSGDNDINHVAWYDRRHGDHTQAVAQKAPNQLGIYDMSGNVWEWCQDTYSTDIGQIPTDGQPFVGAGNERVLRGGCFHNWAIHCTVSKRYQIDRDYHDGCIGFRLALSAGDAS